MARVPVRMISPLARDDGQAEHVLAHRAVAHGVGAAGARGRHAAQAGIGAGVDGEEQPRVLDLAVELLARHAGLHRDRQVLGVQAHDLRHGRHVDADAALHRQQMAFQRRAGAVGDHRHRVFVGQAQHRRHLVGAFAEHHHLGRRHRVGRFVAAVLLAHRGGGGAARAEALLQRGQHRGRHQPRLEGGPHMGGNGCVHGGRPSAAGSTDSRQRGLILHRRGACAELAQTAGSARRHFAPWPMACGAKM